MNELKILLDYLKQGCHSNKIIRTYPHLVNLLKGQTLFLKENATLRERMWYIENNKHEPPNCRVCTNIVSWDPIKNTYCTFCCKKCAQKVREGIPRPESVKQAVSNANRGKTAWNKSIPMLEERKLHLSKIRKERFASGEIIHWNQGNITSVETKQKTSNTLKGHKYFTENSIKKRNLTMLEKKENGWIHSSTLRKGKPFIVSSESRQKIYEASQISNKIRRQAKVVRIDEKLKEYNLKLVEISNDHYTFTIRCDVCNTTFKRTGSVFNPYSYEHYHGEYCPVCFPSLHHEPYSDIFFINNPQKVNEESILYLIWLSSQNESFVKIGITCKDVKQRYGSHIFYDILPIYQIKTTLHKAYTLEQDIIRHFNHLKYIPKMEFGGMTECFIVEGWDDIIQYTEKYMLIQK